MSKVITFDEAKNQYVVDEEPQNETKTAELEQAGILRGITRFEVMGLPLGVAGGTAVLDFMVDKLLGARLASWGALGELGLAFVVKNYTGRFIGQGIADAFALLLTYSAVEGMIKGWLTGVWPGAGTGAVAQAQATMTAYQAKQPGTSQSALGRYAEAF